MNGDLSFISAIGEYAFLQRALIVAVVVGVVSGVVGSIVILRGLSLMGDAISHAVLPGVAVSYMLGVNMFLGAMVTGLATALGITYVEQRTRLKADTAIGVVFSGAFALGIIAITKAEASTNLNNILFGNLLAITTNDLILTLIAAALAFVVIELFYRHLLITTFDPAVAPTYGSSPRAMHYLLMVVLTAVTVAALQAVGIILVVAMLVTPAATALLFARSLRSMMISAAVIGAFASVAGLYLSFTLNLPSGPAIAVVLATIFLIAFVISRLRLRKSAAAIAALALGASGCAAPNGEVDQVPQETDGIAIVATFSLLADLAQQIAGPDAEVYSMVPRGTDPHEYQPLPADLEAVTRADVLIWNGLDMETGAGWFTNLLEVAGKDVDSPQVIEAAAGIDALSLDGGANEVNPHAFISPRGGIHYTRVIANGLATVDPANAAGYEERAEALIQTLKEIDARYASELGALRSPYLVTSERAFQYVANDYGLTEGYLWQIDTEEQGSPAQLTGLITFIREHDVSGILVESNVDRRPMETVSAETGVPIVGEVYSDELGAPGSGADTYVGYLETNLEAYLTAMRR